jgi:hypothetical protein
MFPQHLVLGISADSIDDAPSTTLRPLRIPQFGNRKTPFTLSRLIFRLRSLRLILSRSWPRKSRTFFPESRGIG